MVQFGPPDRPRPGVGAAGGDSGLPRGPVGPAGSGRGKLDWETPETPWIVGVSEDTGASAGTSPAPGV